MKIKIILGISSLVISGSFVVLGSVPQEAFLTGVLASVRESISATISTHELVGEPELPKMELPVSVKNELNEPVPEQVLWSVVFSLPEKLDEAAGKARESGQDDSLWTGYLTRQAGLSEADVTTLEAIASEYSTQIRSSRETISDLVDRMRSQPDPSLVNELKQAQQQKNDVTLQHRDRFRSSIGEERYADFEEWLKNDFSKGFVKHQISRSSEGDGDYREQPAQGFRKLGIQQNPVTREEQK